MSAYRMAQVKLFPDTIWCYWCCIFQLEAISGEAPLISNRKVLYPKWYYA